MPLLNSLKFFYLCHTLAHLKYDVRMLEQVPIPLRMSTSLFAFNKNIFAFFFAFSVSNELSKTSKVQSFCSIWQCDFCLMRRTFDLFINPTHTILSVEKLSFSIFYYYYYSKKFFGPISQVFGCVFICWLFTVQPINDEIWNEIVFYFSSSHTRVKSAKQNFY